MELTFEEKQIKKNSVKKVISIKDLAAQVTNQKPVLAQKVTILDDIISPVIRKTFKQYLEAKKPAINNQESLKKPKIIKLN